MNILAIETSCDETSVAVVRNGRHILANVIASQIPLHQKYGGVVPELASRQHVVTIVPVLDEALKRSSVDWSQVDAIAVTKGPGLSPALLVGVNAAKALAFARRKPLLGVNHMEGHIYSNWLIPEAASAAGETPPEPQFPVLNLIVSGGHSELVLMTGHGQYQMLGKTIDDAAGEAFDKAARILGLGYPGGPAIQRASEGGDPNRFQLPRAWLKGTYDFSFSGLKTALLRKVQEYGVVTSKPAPWQKQESEGANGHTSPAAAVPIVERELPVADLAASFQAAVVDALVEKTAAAAAEYNAREVLVAGGVAANGLLRSRLKERLPMPFRYPPIVLCTDNAAMIAAAAHYRYEDALQHDLTMDIEPSARYV
ncbi:MAG: tRNA (adenosine(37)-N6)-threonylcarbamoyltransferase complex transferase subunit TsaD [Chloroflexota bacterium]|nr:tRNA (adenosine(37)-N6)-threonylcarbamoyltransferase complex transferase subunit TsaD [Chloroflexota bacterium]MDQ5865375.1 tRNA (adenosine(37)-N6)-threonylcarbamoyltransferase complex transferase subunit TsaD [Chloroflexota bacterium]